MDTALENWMRGIVKKWDDPTQMRVWIMKIGAFAWEVAESIQVFVSLSIILIDAFGEVFVSADFICKYTVLYDTFGNRPAW